MTKKKENRSSNRMEYGSENPNTVRHPAVSLILPSFSITLFQGNEACSFCFRWAIWDVVHVNDLDSDDISHGKQLII